MTLNKKNQLVELGAKIMLKNKYDKGFTLIEIVAILILIGILMAVAASKYFDMRDAAQKRAALATVAEAQSRINSVFAEKILGGDTCTVARGYASLLENIDDDNDESSNAFGDYYLTGQASENVINVRVSLISDTDNKTITTATLYLPECGSNAGGGGDPANPVDPNEPSIGNPVTPPEDGWFDADDLIDMFGVTSLGDWQINWDRHREGTIVRNYTGLDGPKGLYINIGDRQRVKLEADSADDWVSYENGKWSSTPSKGKLYMQKNDKGDVVGVYVLAKDGGTISTPPGENWVQLRKYRE